MAEPEAEAANDNLILFALLLLAQLRETKAYPLITTMMGKPENIIRAKLGDITTSGLNRILFSVFDGNVVPLKKAKQLADNQLNGNIIHGKGTLVNETPRIGRNDPCPCGRGKKYKKCCGK